jgi:Mn-dependent DtxR family transcriptional regulator
MDYLIGRKTASTSKQIAKYFIRSDSYVSKTLRDLEKKGLLDVIVSGKIKFYMVKQ